MKEKKIASVLRFIDYKVLEFEYKGNINFDADKIELKFDIDHNIFKNDDDIFFVELKAKIFDEDFKKHNVPFYSKVKILGIFEVNSQEETTEKRKKIFMENNALTILFPYLRALINSLNVIGERPGFIFPPINVIAYLEHKNKK